MNLAGINSTMQHSPVEHMVVDAHAPPASTTSSDNSSSSHPTSAKPVQPPPIFIYGVTDYAKFSKFLKDDKVDDCIRKETKSELILTTATADHYRRLHAVLWKECTDQSNKEAIGALQLDSYQLKSDRAFVVYIRGLPSTRWPYLRLKNLLGLSMFLVE